MEGWLQGSDCSEPWGPLHVLQGEAPRGDVYQGRLLQGEQATGWLADQTPPLETFMLVSGSFQGSELGPRRTHFLGEPVLPN